MSIRKKVYYRNLVLFVQQIQSFVIFRVVCLVKANISTFFRSSTLDFYSSKLSDFDSDALKNGSGMKSCINTPFHCFKVSRSVALNLLTDKTYSLDNTRAQRPSAQYVPAIMCRGMGYNIVKITNRLCFAFYGITPELRVLISLSIEAMRASDFIHTLKEKQEIWHKIWLWL